MTDAPTTVKRLGTAELKTLVAALLRDRKVMAPVLRDRMHAFDWLEDPDRLSFTPGGIPRVSVKEALLPRTEVLFYYKTGKGAEQTALPPQPGAQVLFGVHPCDVRAIRVLDAVFGAKPFPDQPYLARRQATTIVGLGVPAEQTPTQCFFDKLGISSMDSSGCDGFLTPIGQDAWVLELLTDKGRAMAAASPALPDASGEERERLAELRQEAAAAVTSDIDTEELRALLDGLFESPIWAEIGEKCIACGACAYLCPTCHCFDIQDETRGGIGARVRNWDTCQFDQFTKHASGHNPRESQSPRARQRILHKFAYGYNNFGIPFCTGCGRCIGVCPVGNDIRAILDKIRAQR